MNHLSSIFLGFFAMLSASWLGIVFLPHLQFGDLMPSSSVLLDYEENEVAGLQYVKDEISYDAMTNKSETQYPLAAVGTAQRGKLVYQEMGCVYCHTQQVRRKGFGSDFERAYGMRQSVPRDYIQQDRVLLGTMRVGPDLMDVGQRIPDAKWHFSHLYDPKMKSANSIMPPFRFLFEKREILASGPSENALELPASYDIEAGYEIVPTQRAKDLVAYLLSLKLDYELPEAKFSETN